MESESLINNGLEIPRDYDIVKEYKVDSFIINLAGLIPGSTFAGDMEKLCK